MNLGNAILVVLNICFATGSGLAGENVESDDVTGVWVPREGDSRIRIEKNGEVYIGRIAWLSDTLRDDGMVKRDDNNPDLDKRDRPVLGLTIMHDFEFNGSAWVDGKIYNPRDGNTYSCRMELQSPDTLKVRGYVGVSILGKTEIWGRHKE
jgi:uncharacterized protein (DUF2147 family)